jgi:hypothetical protein
MYGTRPCYGQTGRPRRSVSFASSAPFETEVTARWLAETIPGTRRRIELHGARIFFPEERAAEFNQDLRAHWASIG